MNPEIVKLKPIFSKIYGKEIKVLQLQLERYSNLAELYSEKFGKQDVHFFSTPGRTEIGGNHTDHNHGRVLAGSVSLDSIAVAAKNQSECITVYSRGYEEPFRVGLDKLDVDVKEEGTTTSLIRGIAFRLKKMGYRIGGFDACMESDVLPGSGLSSSASVEVLIGTIFNAFFNDNSIPPETIAIIGQYAENNYFGKPCGLMDQVACAMGGIVTIDFKDPQEPVIKKVGFDFDAQKYNLLVVDTGGTHADLKDDYASVPTEMKSVAKAMGNTVCREISMDRLLANLGPLRGETGDRALLRAMHYLGDNGRVLDQVEALENDDFDLFLKLVRDSGNSSFKWLQNIFSTSNTKEQGVALALVLTEMYLDRVKAGACRVHGGGFAGTIQVFLPMETVGDYIDLMEPVFGKNSVHVLRIRSFGTLHLNQLLED